MLALLHDSHSIAEIAKHYHVQPDSIYKSLNRAIERAKERGEVTDELTYPEIRRFSLTCKISILRKLEWSNCGDRALSRLFHKSVSTISRLRRSKDILGATGIRISISGDVQDEDGKTVPLGNYTLAPMNKDHAFLSVISTKQTGYHVVRYEKLVGNWALISPYIFDLSA